jgi:hypothetical protein
MQKKRPFHSLRKSRDVNVPERERYVRREERARSRILRSGSGSVVAHKCELVDQTLPLEASCFMKGFDGCAVAAAAIVKLVSSHVWLLEIFWHCEGEVGDKGLAQS